MLPRGLFYRIGLFLGKYEIIGRSNLRDEGFISNIDIAIVASEMPVTDHTTP